MTVVYLNDNTISCCFRLNKGSGFHGKGPPNAVISKTPSSFPNGKGHLLSGLSGTADKVHTPSSGNSTLKNQTGLKQTLGLKESPPPRGLDVQETGPELQSLNKVIGSKANGNKSEAAILNQVGLHPLGVHLTNHVESNEIHTDKIKSNCGASSISDGSMNTSKKSSQKRHSMCSTPIAKLYPELAEKLERTRSKPEVKLKNDGKGKSQKHSRTMNKLQTKIAQNKIKDKWKKNEKMSPPNSASLASLPSALTREVAPNVTITPEMSALQAQLLSDFTPPHHQGQHSSRGRKGDGDSINRKFPFTSMDNMAPLMNKLGPGGDHKSPPPNPRLGSPQLQQHLLKENPSLPPPRYSNNPSGALPHLGVAAAAQTLAAAAAAAAAKSSAAAGNKKGLTSPHHGAASRFSPPGVYNHSGYNTFPYSVPVTHPTMTPPLDSKANLGGPPVPPLPGRSVSSAGTSQSGSLPMPSTGPLIHPALQPLGGNTSSYPPPPAYTSRGSARDSLQSPTPSCLSTGKPTIPVRLKRPHDLMSGSEARRKLKRHSAVKLYAYHASQRMNSRDLLPLGRYSSPHLYCPAMTFHRES